MKDKRTELKVSAIRSGTVIDHIPANTVFQVFKILGLDDSSKQVYFGTNLDSKKYGKKGKNGIIEIKLKDTNSSKNLEPLFIVDDKETPSKKAKEINPDNIKTMNVLKGKKAIDKYGKKAENGVIEITTKKE